MNINRIDRLTIEELIKTADKHSDRRIEGLRSFALAFVTAHNEVPGGLSIEIGTRHGGSAWLFLELLRRLYSPADLPMLVTVDPYGSKPYNGGDCIGVPIYSDANYVAMKQLLAPYPNHAHFLLPSSNFFVHMLGASYWRPGGETVPVQEVSSNGQLGQVTNMPLGIQKHFCGATFCLLDGDHDHATILNELYWLFHEGWLAPGGVAVVDNVNADPKTLPEMRQHYKFSLTANGETATVFAKEPI